MTPTRTIAAVLLAAGCFALAPARRAGGQQWTRFRGPDGSGLAKAPADAIPVRWTEKDFNWRVKLPGTGHGSPVVWGEKVFLLCADERSGTRRLVCISAPDGREAWLREFPSGTFPQHQENHFAVSTPVVDKDRLYACWATRKAITLIALDHAGKELWRRDLGPHRSSHGPAMTLLAVGDMVVVPSYQKGESFVIAVDAATGKTRWRLERPSGRAGYSTPCLYRPAAGGPAEIVLTSTVGGFTAVSPATGQVLWDCPRALEMRCVGSPVAAGGLLVASSGTGGRGKLVAVRRPAGRKAEVAYRYDRNAPYVPTPLAKGEWLFLLGDSGHVACLRAATGEVLWRDRLPDRFYGSFVCVNDRLYCTSRTGKAYVLAAAAKFELLATNPLAERSFATPAVAGGRMYLRTWSHLISLGGKK